MLNDAVGFKNVCIVTGYTDLRSGMDRLASLIGSSPNRSPFVPDTLYLFCGRRTDRSKGLVFLACVTSTCRAGGAKRLFFSTVFPGQQQGYCSMKLLPYLEEPFTQYRNVSVQEFRFALSGQIRQQVFYVNLVQNIETHIKSSAIIKALKHLCLKQMG